MFFEPDEFEQNLINRLKNELDTEKIVVSEDLIQRTLAAVKESSHLIEVENEDSNLSKIDCVPEYSEKKTVDIEIESKKKKHTKLIWIRNMTSIAAACLVLIFCMKVLSGSSKKDAGFSFGSSKSESSAEGTLEIMPTQSMVTEDSADVKIGASANSSDKFGAMEGSGELEEERSSESNTGNKEVYDTLQNSEDQATGDLNYTLNGMLMIDNIVAKEQESAAGDSNTTYISLRYGIEEEKAKITEIEELLSDINMEESSEEPNTEWVYKIFIQNQEDEISSYFIGESSEIKLMKYNTSGEISEISYQLVNSEDIVSQIKRICLDK